MLITRFDAEIDHSTVRFAQDRIQISISCQCERVRLLGQQ